MRRKKIFIIILVVFSFVLASCSSQQREVLEQTITKIVNEDLSERGNISPEDKKIILIMVTVTKVIDDDTLHVEMFTLFQQEAREANKGMWKEEEGTLLHRILSFVVDFILQYVIR